MIFFYNKSQNNSSLLPDFIHVSMQCILYLHFQPIFPTANINQSQKSQTIINSSACFSQSSLRIFESSSHSSYELLHFILSAYFKTLFLGNLNLRQVLSLIPLKKVFLKFIVGKLHLSQVFLFDLDCIGSLPCSLLVEHLRMLFFGSLSSASIAQMPLETVLLRLTFILPYLMWLGFF